MCNFLLTKHSICGCLIERTTLYCDAYKDAPTRVCPQSKKTHRTVTYKCGCHAWEQFYKREERVQKEKYEETQWKRRETLRRKKEREEAQREEKANAEGSGTPTQEGERGEVVNGYADVDGGGRDEIQRDVDTEWARQD